jgi:molybdate transport system substrate-binding protein
MKIFFIMIFITAVVFVYADDVTLKIAASSNLNMVMEEIKSSFISKYGKTAFTISYNSSGKLVSQIMLGGDFDIFMSADMDYPDKLFKDGYSTDKPVVYATGRLVLFSVKELDLSKWKELILNDRIKFISIVNPDVGPYGKAAVEVLASAGILEKVRRKLVMSESVSSVIQQTIAASDVGFTALSLVHSKNMEKYVKGKNWITIDESLHSPIKQGMVILKNSAANKDVRMFYDYIMSPEAKKIFVKYGYE